MALFMDAEGKELKSSRCKHNSRCQKLAATSGLHNHRHAHSPGVGRAPGLCAARRLAPRSPERLGPAGTPDATPGDADHCGDREGGVSNAG